MTIQENTHPDGSLHLVATYDTMANTYTTIAEYDLALNYCYKALKIRQAKLSSDHPQIAAIYNNVDWLHECEESCNTLPATYHHVTGAESSIRRLKDRMKHS